MAEERAALLRHYEQMRQELLGTIEGLSDEALSDPSLDGWSVKDHLAHIALWDEIRAAEVTRISAGYEPAWRISEGDSNALNDIAHEARRTLSPEQVRWELATTHQRLLEAIAAATARGLDGSRYGEAALRSTHEAEHTGWIHRWRGEQGI